MTSPLVIDNGVHTYFTDWDSPKEASNLRKQLGIPEDNMVFISVGRNNRRRDYARLLEGFKLRDDEISLIIHCGDPKSQLRWLELIVSDCTDGLEWQSIFHRPVG